MSDARPNPTRISQYDAPVTAPDGYLRRVLCIPDDLNVIAAVNDVIGYLTLENIWNDSSVLSEVDMRALMTELWMGYIGELEIMLGAVVPMITDILPTFMLWCDGSSYPRSAYPDLYGRLPAALRIDADTFTVPDLRGKFVLGSNDTYPIGTEGGEASHTLTVDEIPAHHHAYDPVVTPNVDLEAPGVPDIVAAGILPLITENTYDTGGGQAHNNMPPYIALRFAIVAKWRDGC